MMNHFFSQGTPLEINVQPILKNYSCNFGTEYSLEHICFAYYFNYKYTGSVLQVPSVP